MPNPYGLVISIAIFLSILFAKKLIQKDNEDTLWGVALTAIVFGIAGARIYHVIDYLDFYLRYPVEIIKMWNGGLGIWGALIGGFVGIFFYLKKKNKKILPWLDIVSVVTPLGQAIGRWGNFFNLEIFGLPTNLPWGMYIKQDERPIQYYDQNKFHPLFLYESILNTILFVFLFKMYKKHSQRLPHGIFLFLYLGSYSIIRFLLEYLRVDPWVVTLRGTVLNVSQCISILVLAISLVFIARKIKENDIHLFRSQRI